MRGGHWVAAALVAGATIACGPKQPVATPATAQPPAVTLETRIGWVFRLEQQRQLREPNTPAAALPARFATATRADLELLVRDDDPRVRRRATIAIGRTGLADGVRALTAALADPDEEARANAAFGLGVIGARTGVAPLVAALKDPSPLVRARAITFLAEMGPMAKAAVPALVEVYKGNDAQLAHRAGEALKKIDPEAAQKAGVK